MSHTYQFNGLFLSLVLLPLIDAYYLLRDVYIVFHSVLPTNLKGGIIVFHFTSVKTEGQREEITCSQLQN